MRILKIIVFLFLSGYLFAADIRPELSSKLIPDSLKKNAYGVIRSESTVFTYKSENIGVQEKKMTLTVLDKKGKDLADFYYPGDKFRELSNFSAKLYDANGILLNKYGMSDMKTSEWTDSHTLTDDVKRYFFSCDIPNYPFTIVYEYNINFKNGILSFPAFTPQNDHNLSVEKSVYTLRFPESLAYQYKVFNLPEKAVQTIKKGIVSMDWKVENLKAMESEPFEPDFEKITSLLLIRPSSFSYDNVKGSITDWKTFGDWVYSLIKDRNILTDEAKLKIKDLTKDAKSDRERVKILYDYLGKTTRYVSIQLGIGGYQPMLAAEVCKTGFGDCKALTNYLKSMLEVVGIKSNYTVIRLDKTDKLIYGDFANFNQMNHVILQVPLPNDTLWLECTNPRTPFGFVHNGISGHDALVVNEDGGKIYRLPDYADSLNVESFNAKIEVSGDGSAKSVTQKVCKIKAYDKYDWFPLAKPSEQADDLRGDLNIPTATLGPITVKEDKAALPLMEINYSWSTPQYGTKTGNRLFLPVNPFRTTYEGLKKNNRKHEIVISNGYLDSDSIVIVLPADFVVETLPAPVEIKSKFGSFSSNVSIIEATVVVKQKVFISSGSWEVSSYPELVAFFDKISTNYKSKIIVRKKTI